MATGSAGVALSFNGSANALYESNELATAPAFRGQHQTQPLRFNPGKLKGLSEKLIQSHWENNYSGAVKALNAVLSYNIHTKEVHNYWAWDHMHNAPLGYPLLVLDMYEHAYHMDYGAAAAKYIDAFMQNVNWDEVNRRLDELPVRK